MTKLLDPAMRMDFEEWAKPNYDIRAFPDGKYFSNVTNIAFQGYQAGRAHDVDGLIAEIEARSNDGMTVALQYVKAALRKHFGKE